MDIRLCFFAPIRLRPGTSDGLAHRAIQLSNVPPGRPLLRPPEFIIWPLASVTNGPPGVPRAQTGIPTARQTRPRRNVARMSHSPLSHYGGASGFEVATAEPLMDAELWTEMPQYPCYVIIAKKPER